MASGATRGICTSLARASLAALALAAGLPAMAGAQSSARMVEGRVVRPIDGGGEPRPVARQWVVLHRVGSDHSGPLDSVRSAANGSYRFRYTATGSPDALYFVSAMYGGIAYFSPPLRTAAVRGGDADIVVYDTTRDTTALRVQGRHIVVSQARGQRREIAEIFEIENTGARTIVSTESLPSWTTALPDDADSVSVAPGGVTAAAVQFERGRALVFAPLSPGVRQVVLTYLLPNDAFPVSFPLQRPTALLEVLLEDPRGSADGVELREVEAASIEGRTFRRLLGQDLAGSAVVRIDTPPPPGSAGRGMAIVIVAVGAVMFAGLLAWLARRPRTDAAERAPLVVAVPAAQRSRVEGLVAELAALDARQERTESALPEAEYRQQRAAVKAELQRALAAERRPA